MTPESGEALLRRSGRRSWADRIWWVLSMLAYFVASVLVITDSPREKATYWVLVGIFATLQAIYWQRDGDRA